MRRSDKRRRTTVPATVPPSKRSYVVKYMYEHGEGINSRQRLRNLGKVKGDLG